VALEVKLAEDVEAPFCQVLENLGVSDAVLHVRVMNDAARRRSDGVRAATPGLESMIQELQTRAPVRYLEVTPAKP